MSLKFYLSYWKEFYDAATTAAAKHKPCVIFMNKTNDIGKDISIFNKEGSKMPNDKIDIETDGDPKTIYEDTAAHERTGFMVETTTQIRYDDVNDDVIEVEY